MSENKLRKALTAAHTALRAARAGNCDYQWFCDAIKTAEDALSQLTPTLQPQPVTDIDEAEISRMTERGAKAWAGVDAQDLRAGGASADVSDERELLQEFIDAYDRLSPHFDAEAWAERVRAILALRPQPNTEGIPVPTTADQAAAMQMVGQAWLEQHAPDRLRHQPVPMAEDAHSAEYRRGFRDGYERRHTEVLGALT